MNKNFMTRMTEMSQNNYQEIADTLGIDRGNIALLTNIANLLEEAYKVGRTEELKSIAE